MKPTEPGYYFYFDGEDRYLVNVCRSYGAGGGFDGPLMVTELKVSGGGYGIKTIGAMKGEWSRKLDTVGNGVFKDGEAQEMFNLFVGRYAAHGRSKSREGVGMFLNQLKRIDGTDDLI